MAQKPSHTALRKKSYQNRWRINLEKEQCLPLDGLHRKPQKELTSLTIQKKCMNCRLQGRIHFKTQLDDTFGLEFQRLIMFKLFHPDKHRRRHCYSIVHNFFNLVKPNTCSNSTVRYCTFNFLISLSDFLFQKGKEKKNPEDDIALRQHDSLLCVR